MQFTAFAKPDFFNNPYPTYDALRAMGPIVNIMRNVWISGHFEVVDALLRDRRVGRAYEEHVRQCQGEEHMNALVFKTLNVWRNVSASTVPSKC